MVCDLQDIFGIRLYAFLCDSISWFHQSRIRDAGTLQRWQILWTLWGTVGSVCRAVDPPISSQLLKELLLKLPLGEPLGSNMRSAFIFFVSFIVGLLSAGTLQGFIGRNCGFHLDFLKLSSCPPFVWLYMTVTMATIAFVEPLVVPCSSGARVYTSLMPLILRYLFFCGVALCLLGDGSHTILIFFFVSCCTYCCLFLSSHHSTSRDGDNSPYPSSPDDQCCQS